MSASLRATNRLVDFLANSSSKPIAALPKEAEQLGLLGNATLSTSSTSAERAIAVVDDGLEQESLSLSGRAGSSTVPPSPNASEKHSPQKRNSAGTSPQPPVPNDDRCTVCVSMSIVTALLRSMLAGGYFDVVPASMAPVPPQPNEALLNKIHAYIPMAEPHEAIAAMLLLLPTFASLNADTHELTAAAGAPPALVLDSGRGSDEALRQLAAEAKGDGGEERKSATGVLVDLADVSVICAEHSECVRLAVEWIRRIDAQLALLGLGTAMVEYKKTAPRALVASLSDRESILLRQRAILLVLLHGSLSAAQSLASQLPDTKTSTRAGMAPWSGHAKLRTDSATVQDLLVSELDMLEVNPDAAMGKELRDILAGVNATLDMREPFTVALGLRAAPPTRQSASSVPSSASNSPQRHRAQSMDEPVHPVVSAAGPLPVTTITPASLAVRPLPGPPPMQGELRLAAGYVTPGGIATNSGDADDNGFSVKVDLAACDVPLGAFLDLRSDPMESLLSSSTSTKLLAAQQTALLDLVNKNTWRLYRQLPLFGAEAFANIVAKNKDVAVGILVAMRTFEASPLDDAAICLTLGVDSLDTVPLVDKSLTVCSFDACFAAVCGVVIGEPLFHVVQKLASHAAPPAGGSASGQLLEDHHVATFVTVIAEGIAKLPEAQRARVAKMFALTLQNLLIRNVPMSNESAREAAAFATEFSGVPTCGQLFAELKKRQ